MSNVPTYESFREEWLTSVRAGDPSTTALGHRFCHKIVTQWQELSPDQDDIHYCDGAGDGGIDLAFLVRGESANGDGETPQGDTWYLVQSKYGKAFQGVGTLLEEGQKVVATLDRRNERLSSVASGLLTRILNFREKASDLDRIVLVYATVDPLSEPERRAMEDVRNMGRGRLGPLFDVEAISVETIYQRTLEEAAQNAAAQQIKVPLRAHLARSSPDLLIGAVSLVDLYGFLKAYRARTDDLDRIYEKNVRRFLGGRGRVNKRMQQTLVGEPERFGLYNNGITIVVTDLAQGPEGEVVLVEPYIVNGCQTTRTIWEVCQQKLAAGGTGNSPALTDWSAKAKASMLVTKIVKVGSGGEDLLQEITRFTNSQNAVREKDFLALHGDLRSWAHQLATLNDLYLEIQRGGWDSQRAWQRQRPEARQFAAWANAFDLIKVYGAGWLGEAGLAFGKNPPFLPGGAVFRTITESTQVTGGFDAEDLYVAYRLQQIADGYKFGRGAEKASRRQTRFLFYMVAIDLLRDVLIRAQLPHQPKDLTRALGKLFATGQEGARDDLFTAAIDALDEYMTDGTEDSVHLEPTYKNEFNSDMNAFLKWEQLGKSDQSTPRLRSLLAATKKTLGRAGRGEPSPRERITAAVRTT